MEWFGLGFAALVAVVLSLAQLRGQSAQAARQQALPAPSAQVLALLPASQGLQTVTFAGGCFWGVQAVFQHTQGVANAVSGYAGGDAAHATYSQVAQGRTGHAESVQVTFDPRQVSYAQLLHIFFAVVHDPTERNRQGPDHGTQYRSAVFFENPAQQQATLAYVAELDAAKAFPKPIVTQVATLKAFYPAEATHQNYATLHPGSPYIAAFDLPKIAALKTAMPQVFRERPVLVP